jgi:phosphatidate cytidylyltransferase
VLKQRVITGAILALAALAAIVLLPPTALIILLALATLAALWEWSDLAGLDSYPQRIAYCALFVAAMAGLLVVSRLFGAAPRLWIVSEVLGLAVLWWVVALSWIKDFPASSARWGSVPVRLVMGWLALLPAWFAFAFLRLQPHGEWLILFLLVLVAAADIGAYFSGGRFGRRKLAPAVSPGKSWEGFWGGLASALLVAVLAWWWLWSELIGLPALLAVAALTVLASVVGDLAESMLKRQRGVKDSSSLLPGHGGVMDRLDSVSAAAPVFALGLLLAKW